MSQFPASFHVLHFSFCILTPISGLEKFQIILKEKFVSLLVERRNYEEIVRKLLVHNYLKDSNMNARIFFSGEQDLRSFQSRTES